MQTIESKKNIIKEYGKNENDTGSVEVVIALLTDHINKQTGHFNIHKKDLHSIRGLKNRIAQRKKLLNYLKATNSDSYKSLIAKLGIRG